MRALDERPPDRISTPRGTGRNALAVALGLALLFALVALASSGGHHVGGGSGQLHASRAFWDNVTVVGMVAAISAALAIFVAGLRETGPRPTEKNKFLRIVMGIVFAGVVVLVLALGPRWLHLHQGDQGTHHVQSLRAPAGGKKPTGPGENRSLASELWPAFLLFGTALAIAGAYAWWRWSKRGSPRPPVGLALAEVLDEALDDLRDEADARRAIIAAYARLERLLAIYGLPRDAAEAPFEYLRRILDELRVSPAPTLELTDLFERAKFSTHELGHDAKDEAIDALETVRDELRTAA